MNICTRGNCICDAAEWEGDTDCFGEVQGGLPVVQTWTRRLYFLDPQLGLPLSIDDPTAEQFSELELYEDPDLTIRARP